MSIEKEGGHLAQKCLYKSTEYIIKLFIYALLAWGDPVNTELSLEVGGDACYRAGPVTKSEKPKLAWLNNPLLLSFPTAFQLLQGTSIPRSRSARPCELHSLVIRAASQVGFLPLLPFPVSLRFLPSNAFVKHWFYNELLFLSVVWHWRYVVEMTT